ncbi:glycoside hydrolase family 25 protein [Anaerosporobacter sp.]|uniref:glycoside hydrolase family 25 protein n=1 Tax=Anaerosporobacter sp. TaxID=1872529 RepID=UPI00286EC6A0|nr:GH25 family lysozyme [Anaerosporobacter sp.]
MKTRKKITKRKLFLCILTFFAAIIIVAILIYYGYLRLVYPELMGYHVRGIDVARYQGTIDWAEIKEQDITFAFVKATEGSTYSDPNFDYNMTHSQENGIYTSAYHFFTTKSTGKAQAEHFIKTISKYNLDLPPVLDFEVSLKHKGNTKIIDEVTNFLLEVESYFGVKPIIYTTNECYETFLADKFEDYPYWCRDLLKKPIIPYQDDWLFWQYSNRGLLDGIDKEQRYVDLNVFNGDKNEFMEYINNFQSTK